jgi:uncharacterized radical SAM protein YgiQ
MNFLPTTPEELKILGWSQLDIILVSGDTYIDSPFIGVALIGRLLAQAGFKVGIIAQPEIDSDSDITRLGEPLLFWGVSGGSVDSMVANYTASNKRRNSDDFTPGGRNNRRPDRAVIVYTNLIRRSFKHTRPIVLGGIEASLRRIAHYDSWSNRVRKSILFDAKADILVYGMAENTILALADHLRRGLDFRTIPGLCYPAATPPDGFIELPEFTEAATDTEAFTRMFTTFYLNNDPLTAQGLAQRQDNRFLVHNPPAPPLNSKELDRVHELAFSRSVHPYYQRQGKVVAQETIQFALTSHRGCYGECNFCAIAVHQGRTVVSRSEESILREARVMIQHPEFKGNIPDVGGPTANMYGFECPKKLSKGACAHRRCLTPTICPSLKIDHGRQLSLLKSLRGLPGVKRVFVASGIRYDLILADRDGGARYLKELVKNHISGQMKVAPEHSAGHVLAMMGKPGTDLLLEFKRLFERCTKEAGKEQYLTYYFIAAHPGCRREDMAGLREFCRRELGTVPEQVQIFTPTPSTYSTLMYWTGHDPFAGTRIFVEKDRNNREAQKNLLTGNRTSPNRQTKPPLPVTGQKEQRRSRPAPAAGKHPPVPSIGKKRKLL